MKTILIVDDNKVNLVTARTVLSGDYKIVPVTKGQQALTYLESGECDIILLDIIMPEMDGFEVLAKIRQMERCRNIPVIFLTADSDVDTETRCFREGAVDFIAKPFTPEVMLSRIGRALELEELRQSLAHRLEQKTREVSDIKDKAQRDALTGLWDRSYTAEAVTRLLADGTTGALMMMDIDNFKAVNDTYGHASGDLMLQTLADTLRDCFSPEDILCRIGGDEFMVFFKDVTSKARMWDRAMEIITRMHDKVEELGFTVNTSISIGIARAPKDGADFAQLYSCADKTLYYVKRNGKNACHFFSDQLQGESAGGREVVDLAYLQDRFHRTDNGAGAYLLAPESFRQVYSFIHRLVDRDGREAALLLFTLGEGAGINAMEVLEETIRAFMRRCDVATRYSERQIMVVMTGTSRSDADAAAERILTAFHERYGDLSVDYETSCLESRLAKAKSEQ